MGSSPSYEVQNDSLQQPALRPKRASHPGKDSVRSTKNRPLTIREEPNPEQEVRVLLSRISISHHHHKNSHFSPNMGHHHKKVDTLTCRPTPHRPQCSPSSPIIKSPPRATQKSIPRCAPTCEVAFGSVKRGGAGAAHTKRDAPPSLKTQETHRG